MSSSRRFGGRGGDRGGRGGGGRRGGGHHRGDRRGGSDRNGGDGERHNDDRYNDDRRGDDRHGGGGGRGRSRGRRQRRGGGRGPNLRQSAESGNLRERIAIESGSLVFIDQFMLANPQFLDKLATLVDAEPSAKSKLVKDYGGSVVEINPGTYRIERDPFAFSIVIHPDGESPERELLVRDTAKSAGNVIVDTRCVAMIDLELLDDRDLLEKYKQLWFSGQDKSCRDLIRDNGGAVRYGFNRYGDELGIYRIPDHEIICLWPDVVEPAEAAA